MTSLATDAVFLAMFYHAPPPENSFHWGILVKLKDEDKTKQQEDLGDLYHAAQRGQPSFFYEHRGKYSFEGDMTAVSAVQVASPDGSHDYQYFVRCVLSCPVDESRL